MKSPRQFRNSRVRNKVKDEINTFRGVYEMEWLTPYQCRIEGILDLYPTHRKFHNLITNERGGFADAKTCLEVQIKKAYV